jgi:hypothetical protein
MRPPQPIPAPTIPGDASNHGRTNYFHSQYLLSQPISEPSQLRFRLLFPFCFFLITAPHTSAGTTPRYLSAQYDSMAPDSALPNALFPSRVRASESWEGNYVEQTMGTLRFQRCVPTQCNLFLWNALLCRTVACPTSRIMSSYPTRRIFVPIASPATTAVLRRSSLRLRRLFRPSQRSWRDRPLILSSLLLYQYIRLHTPPPDSLHVVHLLLRIRRLHRSSGTGEGYSKEQTQARADYDRKSQTRVDPVDYDHGGCSSLAPVRSYSNSLSFVPIRPASQSMSAKSNRSDYQYSLSSDASPRSDARPRQDTRPHTSRRPQKVRQVSGNYGCHDVYICGC